MQVNGVPGNLSLYVDGDPLNNGAFTFEKPANIGFAVALIDDATEELHQLNITATDGNISIDTSETGNGPLYTIVPHTNAHIVITPV